MNATLRVDTMRCRGSGLCMAMSPDLFRLTGAGTAVVVETEIHGEERVQNARNVAACCPTGAVSVTTKEGQQL